MNQGMVESCIYDRLVFTTVTLPMAIGLSDATVLRLMSQEPARLPPCIFLSRPGALKQKRVWLKETVFKWLEDRQSGFTSPVEAAAAAAAPAPATSRGRGRPRKIEGAHDRGNSKGGPGRPRKTNMGEQS